MTPSKVLKPEDLTKFKSVSDPRLSPDGSTVAFVVTVSDMEENKQKRDIWTVSADGGKPNRITEDGGSGSPRWSPDGETLAFYSTVEKKRCICLMDPQGANRKTLTEVEGSNAFLHRTGETLTWSPDGKYLAYLATDKPKPDHSEIIVNERYMFKHLTGHMDFRRTHVYVIPAAGGEPKQLTEGEYDNHSVAWSSDGGEVYFVSDRSETSDVFVRNNLWAVNIDSGVERQITDTHGSDYRPTPSPDGKYIAYLCTTRHDTSNDSIAEDSHVWIVGVDGTGARDVAKLLDRPCSALGWSPDGGTLYFTASDRGKVPLLSVPASGGDIYHVMHGEWQISRGSQLSISDDGKVVYMKTDMLHPAEVYVANLDGSEEKKLTDFNGSILSEYGIVGREGFWFTTFDGLQVKGYVSKPLDYETGKKYPTLLCIHGGPHGSYGYTFDERSQVFAGAGYACLFIDPRGSSGYGQAFSDGCVLNWGGGDSVDLMWGVDAAIERFDFIDPERMGVTGGSYGGYMTNWVVTQTDRFKAAVSRACVTNLLSFYGTSSVGSLMEQEFFGLPYDNLALLAQWSPITHVKNVKTPLLLLHGEVDYTCPIGQAEEMYKAVKRLGVPTVLVRYQGEGHGIRKKPTNKVDFYQRHLDWFQKYI
jgi:dipeptidyl aminopeptidase/acylaminoacyl peptidase